MSRRTTITPRGFDEAEEKLRRIAERLSDMRPVLTIAAQDLKTLIDDRFTTSTAPNGSEWQPLKPETVERKGSDKPLIDTGILRNSINSQATRRTIRFGTNVPYARTHQFGRGAIPARPFLPIDTSGRLVRSGPAGTEFEAMRQMIGHWVKTGEIR